jgi:mannitol-1-phosphate 5-dehydrogenase
MKAVMYGGGNIGRGFIGALLANSGYEVTFVDVVDDVINTLNKEHTYPVRIIKGDSYEDVDVKNVSAVDGKNPEAVAEAIAEADIMATAVGVNILKFIIPNIVAGLRLRKERNLPPFNIIICENLNDANKVIEGMIKEQLTEEEIEWFDANIGLVEAAIGRMVPIQTEEMKDGNPLRVCVEAYGYLQVDKEGFKGEIPEIKNMVPFSPFDYYVKRKLFVHNMGHAITAYLGDLLGIEYIYEAIDNDEIYIIVKGAMEESARALSKKYDVSLDAIMVHIKDLLMRFTNKGLQDTCGRVGREPARKLAPKDRLVGSATLAYEMGIIPAYIAIGAAAGLCRYMNESEDKSITAKAVLEEVCGLGSGDEITKLIMDMYDMMRLGKSFGEIRRVADKKDAERLNDVI